MYLPGALREHCADWGNRALGTSGADIAMIARDARLNALRRVGFKQATPVTAKDATTMLEARLPQVRTS